VPLFLAPSAQYNPIPSWNSGSFLNLLKDSIIAGKRCFSRNNLLFLAEAAAFIHPFEIFVSIRFFKTAFSLFVRGASLSQSEMELLATGTSAIISLYECPFLRRAIALVLK